MPELPDVEVFRRYFAEVALNRRISGVWAEEAILDGTTGEELERVLASGVLSTTYRHGKYLFAGRKGDAGSQATPWLVIHFGMTGYFTYREGAEGPPKHTRMCISFADGGRLGWSCQRKLGRIRLAERVDAFVRDMKLGPDALSVEVTEAAFADRIGKSRGSVKSALMNQSAIAGIGNVYADEILHQAGIHPGRKPVELGAGAFRKLYDSMRDVLERTIAAGAAPEKMPAEFLLPRREAGAACACGTPIEKIIISGRTGYYCPRCQT